MIDIEAVRADDALIEAVRAGLPVDAVEGLAAQLAAWRDEVQL